MSEPAHDLERLISRHLDDECSRAERRELNARLHRDPQAAALFEEHSALDREIKHALRGALGRAPVGHRPLPGWERAARVFALATAACLAVILWSSPAHEGSSPGGQPPAQAGSWFGALPTAGDTLVEPRAHSDRPQIRFSRPESNWIVIPSDTPGEFLVIEVSRVPTRTIYVHRDF